MRASQLLVALSYLLSFNSISAFHSSRPSSIIPFQRQQANHRSVPLHSTSLQWQSHVSTHPDPFSALQKVLNELTDKEPHLAFLFVGQFHGNRFADLVKTAASQLPKTCHLLSVVGGGVVGENVELDEPTKPSLSLLTGRLPPGASVETFSFNELSKPPPSIDSPYWKHLNGSKSASYFLLGDPWSPIETVMHALGKGAVVTGGISVPTGAGPTVAIGAESMSQGSIVGIRFSGSVGIQAIVAQGCRPVGPVFIVTECEQHVVLQLDGHPAVQALEKIIKTASSEDEKRQISGALVVGLSTTSTSDYLIRQVAGFIPQKGGIIVGGNVRVGDKFRFHVRDKKAAEEDLRLMVKRAQTERTFHETSSRPLAALQVSCVARGRYMYGEPNIDISLIKDLINGVSIGGFYANGELGPVGLAGFSGANDRGTFMHGFTTVVALLCESVETKSTQSEDATSVNEPLDTWG